MIHYTATAGNLLIRDDQDKANGSIFYVAYTEDGAEAKNRPVTFFYNGGAGCGDDLAAYGIVWARARDYAES